MDPELPRSKRLSPILRGSANVDPAATRSLLKIKASIVMRLRVGKPKTASKIIPNSHRKESDLQATASENVSAHRVTS